MITVEKLEKGTYFDDAFKISFRYDPTTVAKVKELAERRYLPEDRAWEIPAHELPALIEKVGFSDVCGGYRVLRALYNLSRIPERYRYTIALKPENGEDLEAFTVLDNYKNDVLNMVDEGRGLYIWGKSTGNGKTSWACKIMSYFFRKIAFNTGLENEGLYIFLPTFLEDLRDNYDNKDPEFDEILRMIKTCRLLIIDDIGAERVTDWVRERMVSIINTRVSNNLTTLYTSNLSPEELRSELGDRIASRVLGSSQVVEITSGDRRGL